MRRVQLMKTAPLPMRQGVAPSRVYLPPGPWATVFDFLQERFPALSAQQLLVRLKQGDIVDAQGLPQSPDTPYLAGGWLWYYRKVEQERKVPFSLKILYHDERLVVIDKPHFLASVPGGQYVQETALSRLRHLLQQPLLTPIHRLDRETAGVMVFCVDPASRGAYQSLFQSRAVQKEYEALAAFRSTLPLPCCYRSRIEHGQTRFFMQEVAGSPNSETFISLLARKGRWAHYLLRPTSGRKHQLRVHLNALKIPILNDRFYPKPLPIDTPDDFNRPLQLLARALEFTDPITGQRRRFESKRHLWPLESINQRL